MEPEAEMERLKEKAKQRENPRQAELPTAMSFLVCLLSTHVLLVNPVYFLRYSEWVSAHIRKPNINGRVGRNCMSKTLGHQPARLNLQ